MVALPPTLSLFGESLQLIQDRIFAFDLIDVDKIYPLVSHNIASNKTHLAPLRDTLGDIELDRPQHHRLAHTSTLPLPPIASLELRVPRPAWERESEVRDERRPIAKQHSRITLLLLARPHPVSETNPIVHASHHPMYKPKSTAASQPVIQRNDKQRRRPTDTSAMCKCLNRVSQLAGFVECSARSVPSVTRQTSSNRVASSYSQRSIAKKKTPNRARREPRFRT